MQLVCTKWDTAGFQNFYIPNSVRKGGTCNIVSHILCSVYEYIFIYTHIKLNYVLFHIVKLVVR